MFPVGLPLKKKLTAVVCLFLLFTLTACGKKANPIIPMKVIPKEVDALSYQIKGKSLILTWPIPKENTDNSPLTDLKGFSFLKGEWPTKDFCPTCPEQFQETHWIDLKGPELPDIRVEPDQIQVTLEKLKPGNTYLFQVTAVTKKEATSKPSKTLSLAWDLPLKPPSELQMKLDQKGLLISWLPSSSLLDGSVPEGLAGYTLERKMEKGPWNKVNTQPIEKTAYLDSELQEGVTYGYRVKALRKVSGNLLESEGSEEKEIVYTRIAPPLEDLVAFLGPNGVELRWQGIDSMIPSGYHIYKRMKNEKTPKKITPETVKDTIFEDRQVKRGITYLYSVSAVGSPPALLEGSRSKEVEITFNP
jgi:hypothetical protein